MTAEKIDKEETIMNKGEALVNIGLEHADRQKIAHALSTLLADEYVLYVKTQKYHWNVVGKFFGSLHELFGDQYEMLAKFVDRIAERIRALGFDAIGTLEEFKAASGINELPGKNPTDLEMIKTLLEGHEYVIRSLRDYLALAAKHNDMGTDNMLAELLEQHEKVAWMLRVHLLEK
jgi:starvation-inducible DNA-binding protein